MNTCNVKYIKETQQYFCKAHDRFERECLTEARDRYKKFIEWMVSGQCDSFGDATWHGNKVLEGESPPEVKVECPDCGKVECETNH